MAASLGAAKPPAGKCGADAHAPGAQHFVCRLMLCRCWLVQPTLSNTGLLDGCAVEQSSAFKPTSALQHGCAGGRQGRPSLAGPGQCGEPRSRVRSLQLGGAREEGQHTEAGQALAARLGEDLPALVAAASCACALQGGGCRHRLRAAASGRLERSAEACRAHRGQPADSRAERDSGQASLVGQAASERRRGRASGGPGGGGAFFAGASC